MTQVAQRNNHVLQMLKRLKETLENDKKKYADKVNVLVMTWERIAASAREQRPLAAICIVEKMYMDTLNIMLQGEWPKMSPVSKTHLMQMLNRCRIDLCKEMPWLNCKFKKLIELVNEPWTLPSLERIMHKDPSPATPEQIVEFCESERGLLIVTRLNMLCSSRCEKVAIKLAEACFQALTTGSPSLLSLFTKNQYFFIFDIYLCLLYKYKKLESIINALKPVSVRDGYSLLLRLKRRHDFHEQKIWKFSIQVATVAARYFVTVSMLSRNVPNPALLKDLIKNWLLLYNASENNLENEIRKIIQPAETSEHIYIMAEVLAAMSVQFGNKMYSSLIMELYIRALTADINYLERVKLQNDREQMTAYEKHLAAKFLDMADLVKDHAGVRREFVLTAFSIHPSAEIYRRVEEEAVASGKASPHSTPTSQESMEVGVLSEGLSSLSSEEPDVKETAMDYSVNNDSQDSGAFVEISNRCSLHLPYDGIGPEGELCFQCGDFTGVQSSHSLSDPQQTKKERSLDALILIKGNTVTESLNYDVLSAPSQVLESEKLGLSSQVCADLVTLLGSNRYHLLTWVLEWGELSSRCLRYMDEADTIKSGKKELKFLEIDYNQYKDWPENEEEVDCIEKGYEQWLEDGNTETDFDTDSKRSNTDDSEEMSMLKTAIRRSQKQTGRYAESSSDSDDSRARSKSKKRSRAKKRYKYMSDSGSISDSIGSDGQKSKRNGKKPRKQSKDLRKKLCSLRVLEMAQDNATLPQSNEKLTTEVLDSPMLGLPNALSARSDPTVLKSLRAFRLSAHKPKQNELVQEVTKNYQNSKSYPGKVFTVSKKSVFDCNDNKFITKDDSLAVGTNEIEMHFKNNGVKTKKYNDIIRTIKEDLISVSNIPNITNNATVQVVHLHDASKPQDISQSQSTDVSSSEIQSNAAPSTSVATELISNQKMKPVNESHGSHIRKTASSQSTIQNVETTTSTVSTTIGKTYLSTALTRSAPTARVLASGFGNVVTVVSLADPNRIINQQQYKTIMSRNSVNQNRVSLNESANNRNILSLQISSAPNASINNNNNSNNNNNDNDNNSGNNNSNSNSNSKNTCQNIAQTDKTAGQVVRAGIHLSQESERQYATAGRGYSVQNMRTATSVLNAYSGRQMGSSVQNTSSNVQLKKAKDSNANQVRSSGAVFESANSADNTSRTFEDLPNAMNAERASFSAIKVQAASMTKVVEQLPGTNVIVNPASSNVTKGLPVKYTTEQEVQSMNGNYFPQNNANNLIRTATETNVIATTHPQRPSTNKPVQKLANDRVTFQTNMTSSNRNYSMGQVNGPKRNLQLGTTTAANVSQVVSNSQDGMIVATDGKCFTSEEYNPVQIKSTTTLAGLLLDGRSNSPVVSSSVGNRTFPSVANIYGNKTAYGEVINVIQDVQVTDVNSTSATTATTINVECNTLAPGEGSPQTGTDVLDSSGESYEGKLSSPKTLPNKNILATVLKRNAGSKAPVSSSVPQFSQFTTRSAAIDPPDSIANVLVTQGSSSSTIHYTVINPNSSVQNIASDSLNSVVGDMVERVVKQDDFAATRSVMSPLSDPTKTSIFEGGTVKEEVESREEVSHSSQQQKVIVPSKKVKANSSQSVGQTESGFIKKQVFNNQKITILVQNNGENQEELESLQKNKLSELLLRDDQKTCITFRAIKRTQTNVSANESPPTKKALQSGVNVQNGETEVKAVRDEPAVSGKEDASPSGTLCQYLVLEAINDPSGALPKFNQAFGKSYQIKVPQPVKALDSNENSENAEAAQIQEEPKSDPKSAIEPEIIPPPVINQVPVTSSVRGNTLGIVQKSVKNVYIDKEVKTDVQSSSKISDGNIESSVNIPAIHMTEIQQPSVSVNAFQNLSKTARSTVVQQLIRKVPTTGPSTLQGVNSFSAINSRQVKTQDVVSAPTLIYATAARAQSQILIQRAVGRVNAPTLSQVAPVIYTQQPSDQTAPQTQTLLLAAVPTGTRGVVPGTQLVRLPSNSGIWKMAPSVSPSRIVQLRPQNLVLQGNQDQGVLMHSTQPVLLHHLTSLPVKPIGVVANTVKSDETVKIDLKNDIYVKNEGNADNAKLCSLEVHQTSAKNDSSRPVNTATEHETVALMKDIKEFENVFEETKLKFEMEEQQGGCLPEVENVSETKSQALQTVDVSQEPQSLATHQTVLVQPQLMLHKPQMIITSTQQNQPTVFRQKIEKEFTLEKDSEERLLLTQKPKKDIQLGMEEGSQPSHVTLAYVSHPPATTAIQKPLVVVTNYGQPPSSPAPSITSQSSSSPNSIVGTASFSSTTGSAKASSKSKTRNIKTVTNPTKSPPVSKPQQKPQEDANTAQKIYAILEEYAVQLRNSPDMNNRPAPRRRSNPPTSANSKRKRTVCKSKESLSDGDDGNYSEDVTEPLPSSEDSSSGVTVLQVCVSTSH